MVKNLILSGLFVLALTACNSTPSNKETGETTTQDNAAGEQPVIPDLIVENFAATFEGSINEQYKITLQFNKFNSILGGSYNYQGKSGSLQLRGSMQDTGELILNEFNALGEQTGVFEGKLVGETISGKWYNAKRTKSMPFTLKRSNIASLQTKSDVLSDALGLYTLSSIAGDMGANTMFDTYQDKGKWVSSSSGIISSSRVVTEVPLTSNDIELLNNFHIVVDDHLNVHVYAGLSELINCKFNPNGMELRMQNDTDNPLNEKLKALNSSTIFNDNRLILLASNHMDFTNTLKGGFDVIASDNMILTYNPVERKFELDIFESTCCNGNILTFDKK